MYPKHLPIRKSHLRLVNILFMIVIASLACNLPFNATETEAPPPQPAPTMTPRIDSGRPTDAPAEEQPAPADVPETGAPIPPADNPAIPDCNAFDLNAFNAIIDGTFNFVRQDQLNNCHFESDNDFRLMIGGGKPSSSEEIRELFETSFGTTPDSTWEAIDDYYLGLAYSSVSVTAQGVSASGHSMVIVAASQPGSDPDALKQIFEKLARKAAQQLNMQF